MKTLSEHKPRLNPNMWKLVKCVSWTGFVCSLLTYSIFFPLGSVSNNLWFALLALFGFLGCLGISLLGQPPPACRSCSSTVLKSSFQCERCLNRTNKSLKSFAGSLCCSECDYIFKNYTAAHAHFLQRHDTSGIPGGDYPWTYKLCSHMADIIEIYYVYNHDMELYKRK